MQFSTKNRGYLVVLYFCFPPELLNYSQSLGFDVGELIHGSLQVGEKLDHWGLETAAKMVSVMWFQLYF